ncbi:MAG: transcriptional repressor [Bacteroidota bacterium]
MIAICFLKILLNINFVEIIEINSMVEGILKDFGLRKTKSREDILELFIDNEYALSQADIESHLSHTFDRVTVYRTIRTFQEKGLIHKILTDEGAPKYALCSDECAATEHHHEHVHFKCENCGQTTCLDDIDVPKVELPQGYNHHESNLLINGTCPKCV